MAENNFDWRSIAGAVAPLAPKLGTVLGASFGPFGGIIGGLAGSALAAAFGTAATPEAVGTAIANDPDAAEKIQAVEESRGQEILAQAQVETERLKQVTEQLRISAVDTADARKAAQVQTPYSALQVTMGGFILIAFMGLLVAAVFKPESFTNTPILVMLLGGMMALVQQIGSFLWGSNVQSAAKTDSIGTALVNAQEATKVAVAATAKKK